MPLTRLIRLTLVLSWILFLLYVFFLDIDRWGKFRYSSLLLALLLWGFSLFLSIKNSAAFDEHSFHRTRPYGDRRAFWQHTRMIGWTLLLVFCAMLIRGLFYHLGWRATLTGASSLILLLLVLSTGLSSAYSLCLSGVHRKKLAFALLFYLPALCLTLIMGQVIPSWMRIGNYTLYQWAFGVTNALVFTVVFPCLAWFFAGSLRRWKTSLALAVIAIFLQPFHLGRALNPYGGPSTEDIKTASLNLRLRDKIEVTNKSHLRSISQFLRCHEPMRDGEFVVLAFRFAEYALQKNGFHTLITSGNRDEFPQSSFSLTSKYGEFMVLDTPRSSIRRPERVAVEDLFPNARFYGYQDTSWTQYSNFNVQYTDEFYNLLTKSIWKCSGYRYRLERIASFRLDTGGKFKLKGGGLLIASRLAARNQAVTAQVNLVRPIIHNTRSVVDFVLTNADETKALVMSANREKTRQFSAISSETYPFIAGDEFYGWTAEDIRDAKIHVLETKTLERIQFDQTHLILEE